MSRPVKYTKAIRNVLRRKFKKYIEDTEMPIICEFAYLNNIPSTSLYDFEELSTLIQISKDKKKTYLESQGLQNKINVSMATLSLKQIGWSEKVETNNTNRNIEEIDEADLDDKINELLALRDKEKNQDKIKDNMRKGFFSNKDE